MCHSIMALPETIGDGIGRRAGCRKRGDGIAIVHHVGCKSSPNRIELVVEQVDTQRPVDRHTNKNAWAVPMGSIPSDVSRYRLM